MKEKLLVLAKAYPLISRKYEELVCVAGITDKGEWRRVYPIPWECFWSTSPHLFRKKCWIEYELKDEKPSDHRKESRKIIPNSLKQINEEVYQKIRNTLIPKLTTVEDLEKMGHRNSSLGVIKPEIMDFVGEKNEKYEKFLKKKEQKNLFGKDAVRIEIPDEHFSYVFKCGNPECKGHKMMCEDWELAELYRHCKEYLKVGKYKDKAEVFEKVKNKMFKEMLSKQEIFFVIGTHYRFNSFMIIGVIYPKKGDLIK